MSKGRSLDSIKQRIANMKEKIEETEERETTAKGELIKAKARQLTNETEAKSLSNRVESLRAELQKVNEKYREICNQLDQNTIRSEESERNRKNLEDKEEEGYEQTRELEASAKLAKYDKEEQENKYKEATLREQALENDVRRAEQNLKRAKEKADELEKQLNDMMSSTGYLENNVNELHEKEDDVKEKITFLNDQIKEISAVEEERRAKQKTAERYRDKLKVELKREEDKLHEVERQFKEIEEGC